MAMNNKERQAAYRARQKENKFKGTAYRLNTQISGDAHHALDRLMFFYNATKRTTLETAIIEFEKRLRESMSDAERKAYMSGHSEMLLRKAEKVIKDN
ncbi:MAG: hypothetical protein N0C82_17400 [Candidatus Thiodiazotropha endolucinida]|nr:hypothetical protein [Candidatus Thiodiazotropha taylori]MCW4297088.1 hypothetical protein [Candidatus Thiodiazotropha endolucinida]